MKIYNSKISRIGLIACLTLFFMSCTKNFEEINKNPNEPDNPDGSLRLATLQVYSFGEPRFVTWRGNIIFASQFANQYVYNFAEMAWFPGKTYVYSPGWTDNVWQSSFIKVGSNIHTLLSYVQENGGNKADEAVVRIIGSWFYQKMTDLFGDIPYSEVFKPTLEVALKPKFDKQSDIYKAIIDDLGKQMSALESSKISISGGDFLYKGSEESWKAFANTLRLRMALRSRAAFEKDGDGSYIEKVIEDCLDNKLIDEKDQAIFKRAQSGFFLNDPNELMGGPEDVWNTFAFNQSQWVLNENVVALLRDNNDPRLKELCSKPDSSETFKGTEPNLNADNIESWYKLSHPTAALVGASTSDPVDAHIITAAESYFLQAEAAELGIGSGGDAQELYQKGISAHMQLYNVGAGDFFDEDIAKLNGSKEENLEKIYWQRWLSHIGNGYEAWAVARRTGIIKDQDMGSGKYLPNDTDGRLPSRLRYPNIEQTLNAANLDAAVSRLDGGDLLTSKIWWNDN